jgi:protein O-GlcNAc transferase
MDQILLERAREAQRSGRLAEAADLYTRVLRSDSSNVPALFLFGRTLLAMSRRAEALAVFERILEIDASNSAAKLQRGNALLSLGRFDSAIAAFDKFLAAEPANGEAWHNRGMALAQTKRFSFAAESFGKALALHPESAASWHNRGVALAELGDFEQAVRDQLKAIGLQPDLPDLRGDLVLARLNCCDWQGFEDERLKIAEAISLGKPAIVPFGNLFISDSPADQLQCARIWMGRHVAASPPPLWRGERYNHKRLRVAYVSGDFRSHPVASLMLPIFESCDRERFECFGISFGADDKSDIRRRISSSLEHFEDVRARSDMEIAVQLRGREIDIAVDLMGITAECRPGIFAARPAPVQVGYLGFPGTSGSDSMDYVIADRIVIPEDEQHHYSEKIAWLPHCYMPCGSFEQPHAPISRTAAGLPENSFVFCCFNGNYKILPSMFASWMAILRATENSILWLADPNPPARANLQREAGRHGVAPDRLNFAPHVPSAAEHLKRIAAADLFLDTLPFNAHSTAIDAISAGVPVLTCAGSTMAGRAGASLLVSLDVPELVAPSIQEYQRRAISFAHDAAALGAVRAKIARQLMCTPDAKTFTGNLEAVFVEMHDRRVRGVPAQSFALPGDSV